MGFGIKKSGTEKGTVKRRSLGDGKLNFVVSGFT